MDRRGARFRRGRSEGDRAPLISSLDPLEALCLRLSEPGPVEPPARARSRTQCGGDVADRTACSRSQDDCRFPQGQRPGHPPGLQPVYCALRHDGPLRRSGHRHRWQQVQGGQQSGPEFHARQDAAVNDADRGERRALFAPTRQRRPAGAFAGAHDEVHSPQREDRKAESGNGATEGTRCTDAGHTRPADIADRSRCPFDGNKRSHLASVAKQTKDTLGRESLDVVADRGYFNSTEILACEEAGITVTLPKPMTSNAKADGRFGKQDFRYMAGDDVYICPAGESLTYRYTNEEHGLVLRRYWTNACPNCAVKHSCTPSKERRITRWEHEHVLEAVQRRLDEHPEKMRQRRETVEHPFGTIKARMGATHFLMKTLPRVATEMALHVLTYNLTRLINIMGPGPLIAAIRT